MEELIQNYVRAQKDWSAVAAAYLADPSVTNKDRLEKSFKAFQEATQCLQDQGKTIDDLYSYLFADLGS
jgi:hypothetical protein